MPFSLGESYRHKMVHISKPSPNHFFPRMEFLQFLFYKKCIEHFISTGDVQPREASLWYRAHLFFHTGVSSCRMTGQLETVPLLLLAQVYTNLGWRSERVLHIGVFHYSQNHPPPIHSSHFLVLLIPPAPTPIYQCWWVYIVWPGHMHLCVTFSNSWKELYPARTLVPAVKGLNSLGHKYVVSKFMV